MTGANFLAALKALWFLDRDEFERAVYPCGVDPENHAEATRRWNLFRGDPARFMVRADQDTARRLWSEVERQISSSATGKFHIIFDGVPGPQGPRFIEAETPDGKSVNVGNWQRHGDSLWALVIDPNNIGGAKR